MSCRARPTATGRPIGSKGLDPWGPGFLGVDPRGPAWGLDPRGPGSLGVGEGWSFSLALISSGSGNYPNIIFSEALLEAPPGSWDAPVQPHIAPSHFFLSLDFRRMGLVGNYPNIIFSEAPLEVPPGSWDAPGQLHMAPSHFFRSLDFRRMGPAGNYPNTF